MNGLIVQWGTQKATDYQESAISFFPSFSNGNSYYLNFVTQYERKDDYYRHQVYNKSGSSCTVCDYSINTTNNFDWFAIGY